MNTTQAEYVEAKPEFRQAAREVPSGRLQYPLEVESPSGRLEEQ